jgi:hypothetical protein
MIAKFHVEQNSVFIEIVRVRFKSEFFIKAQVRWCSKASGAVLFEERSLKIPLKCFEHWEIYTHHHQEVSNCL